MSEPAWTDNFTYAGRCGHTITVRRGQQEPHDCTPSPAATEGEVRLTEAECDDLTAELRRWHQIACLDAACIAPVVERIIAERVRVAERERDRWEHIVTQVEGERDAAREALQRIYDDHQRQTETWNHRNFPTENASHWHDGFVTACAKHAIEAKKGLDPEGAANDDRVWKIGATGTDLDWYHETGHCGRCGDVATNCGCNGECGCFSEHGPRKEPYVSPTSRAESAEAARAEMVAKVEALISAAEYRVNSSLSRDFNGNPAAAVVQASDLRGLLGGEGA